MNQNFIRKTNIYKKFIFRVIYRSINRSQQNIKNYAKSIAERIAEKKRNFSNTTKKNSGGGHKQTPTEDDIKYGIVVPTQPLWQKNLAKGIGCFMWIWLYFQFRDEGKIILQFSPNHFALPIGDTESDDDDEYIEKNFKFSDNTTKVLVDHYVDNKNDPNFHLHEWLEEAKKTLSKQRQSLRTK